MKQIILKDLLIKNNIKEAVNENAILNIIKTKKYVINNIEHTKCICEGDSYFWIVNQKIHHELENPAVSLNNGKTLIYVKHNFIFRDNDKPSLILYGDADSYQRRFWFKNGLIHRDNDKPALEVVDSNRLKEVVWYNKGLIHRDNDQPAFIDHINDIKIWFQKGLMHRENGYAFMNDSDKYYYINNVKLNKDKFIKYRKINNF